MGARHAIFARVLGAALLLHPTDVLAQEPSGMLNISFDAEATMRPATGNDITCPASFAPALIQVITTPETDMRGTVHQTGPVVRRGVMTERTATTPAFQSRVAIEVTGCSLKRHFLPVSGQITVEIDKGGSAAYRQVFMTETIPTTRSFRTDYHAVLMGPERAFGVTYYADPLLSATQNAVGVLRIWLSQSCDTGDICIDVGTCEYGVGTVAARLVIADAG